MLKDLRYSIRRLVAVVAATIAAIVLISVWLAAENFGGQLQQRIQSEFQQQLDGQLNQLAVLAKGVVKAEADGVVSRVRRGTAFARYFANELGGFRQVPEHPTLWRAVNQFDRSVVEIQLPALGVGDILFAGISEFSERSPFVDVIGGVTGDTVTVFQRMNSKGDMLRVGTNVPQADGSRATGTFIPAFNPDGSENQVVSSILDGNAYQGEAWVVNKPYVTRYEPIFEDNTVVGMLYVGVAQDALRSLHEAIQAIAVQETGYVTIVQARGPDAGRFVVPPNPQFNGMSILDLGTSQTGRERLRELLDRVRELSPHESHLATVDLLDKINGLTTPSVVRATYFPQWGWAILVVAKKADFSNAAAFVIEHERRFEGMVLSTTAIVVGCIVFMIIGLGNHHARQVDALSSAVNQLAEGNTNSIIPQHGSEELRSFGRACESIKEYMTKLEATSQCVANGDLQSAIEPRSEDDRLSRSFCNMLDKVRSNQSRLERETARQSFQERTNQSILMAVSEREVIDAVSRIVDAEFPDASAKLMLADSSHAHLKTHEVGESSTKTCSISAPHECPSIRNGATKVFKDAADYDSCPKLAGIDGCAAICHPIQTTGKAVGVMHMTLPKTETGLNDSLRKAQALAGHIGTRVSMIRAFQQSELQASTDSLTGLFNRRTIENRVDELGLRTSDYAVIFADLDHFKRLNDKHGHETGDRALKLFARVLNDSCRSDDIAGRWGGEEFIVILPKAVAEHAARLTDRVRIRLREILNDSAVPGFTASFGVVDASATGDFLELISMADQALYRAKQGGRDRTVIHSTSVVTLPENNHTEKPAESRSLTVVRQETKEEGLAEA